MIVTTKGLVIRTVNYSESSVVATIYTSELGIRTYMIKGVRSSKKKKGNIYQPMQFLDLIVTERGNKNMQYIKDAKPLFHYKQVPYDIRKTAIGLFMLELISITVKEMEPNEELYEFIQQEYENLDIVSGSFSDYHLQFMLSLSQLLGFFPYDNYTEQNHLFALQDGLFVALTDNYPNCISKEDSQLLHRLMNEPAATFNKPERKQILQTLERYYQFHVAEFRSFKTPDVFEGIFG